MDFVFYVDRYTFCQLKEDARLAAEQVGLGGLVLEFDKPSPLIKALLEEGEKVPLLERVPDYLGNQEMSKWNGLWVACRNDASWSFVTTKWQVNGSDYWSIKCTFSPGNLDAGAIKSTFLQLIESISPDLAFAYDDFAAPYSVSYFKHSLGPWAGLRDVYWLNYYGKRYASLIARDTFRQISEVMSLEDVNDGFLFVVDKGSLLERHQIIEQIGKDYFVETPPLVGGATEKVGILQLFKTIYSLSRDKGDREEIAAKRPPV
jgi:hypothetical protein